MLMHDHACCRIPKNKITDHICTKCTIDILMWKLPEIAQQGPIVEQITKYKTHLHIISKRSYCSEILEFTRVIAIHTATYESNHNYPVIKKSVANKNLQKGAHYTPWSLTKKLQLQYCTFNGSLTIANHDGTCKPWALLTKGGVPYIDKIRGKVEGNLQRGYK